MISAFGIDHTIISKVNVKPFMGNLAPTGKLNLAHGGGIIGAGSKTSAKRLSQPGSHSSGNFPLARKQAKKSGKLAGQRIAQGQPTTNGGWNSPEYHGNTGWQQKATAWSSLPKTGKSPVGMRGKVSSRVQTKAMREKDRSFT